MQSRLQPMPRRPTLGAPPIAAGRRRLSQFRLMSYSIPKGPQGRTRDRVLNENVLPDLFPGNDPTIVPVREKRCDRSEEHTSELQSLAYLVCRLLLEKKK